MEDMQLIRLLQLVLAQQDRFKNEAEYYTYQIQHTKIASSDLFLKAYTALIRSEVFDKIAFDIYNILYP